MDHQAAGPLSFPLMRLAPELRLLIYEAALIKPRPLLVTSTPCNIHGSHHLRIPNLLSATKQIGKEASPIYFGLNTVVVHTKYETLEYGWLEGLTRQQQSSLRDVRFAPCSNPYRSTDVARRAIRELYWLLGRKHIEVLDERIFWVAVSEDDMMGSDDALWVSVDAVKPYRGKAEEWSV
ncbi:hypothetical protein LTR85_000149 [Meristemomyces frigidus]|nr:hypothetical protein LTR85_000149 [Meristemomyces frigidus]